LPIEGIPEEEGEKALSNTDNNKPEEANNADDDFGTRGDEAEGPETKPILAGDAAGKGDDPDDLAGDVAGPEGAEPAEVGAAEEVEKKDEGGPATAAGDPTATGPSQPAENAGGEEPATAGAAEEEPAEKAA